LIERTKGMQQNPRRQMAAAASVLMLVVSGTAWACGFEDPGSVASQRGIMNLAFPKSAWVRTAIWQAQMAGDLPRDELAGRDAPTPQAIAAMQSMRATWLLKALAKRLGTAPETAPHPSVAIVLMGPMLWSRIEPRDSTGAARVQVHVSGPESGDVVLVTDTPAIEAIVSAGMGFERAQELGLVRLYGPAVQISAVQAWLGSTR
jgi:hypothetical protein